LMPQFDTFSFFSQLFWLFFAFSYLYLILCFYILPAFAAVLKIRAKKLAQIDVNSSSSTVTTASSLNLIFLQNLTTKLGGIYFYSKNLANEVHSVYSSLILKNETFYQFNFFILNQFKIVTFF
jgi:hypothetical protein